nr:Z1 domain-containing protein [Qipengyuania xiamenensis]
MAERETFEPEVAETLQRAILYFLGCCAARRARGDANKHMTMLVHTSAYVVAHDRVAACMKEWVDSIREAVMDPASETGQRLAAIWDEEKGRLPREITEARSIPSDELFDHIGGVLEDLEFPIENGTSDNRIDYEKPARTYIVTGGSILARGLTLEGLMVSYFLRSAKQYDTLLQMGRWFGYRPNYEDLPRIWMPEDLKLSFRNLARVEMEIREDIERYHLENKDPMDIAVRIRAIPGMAITGATKMRAARTCAISYWGTHRQTYRFHYRDADELVGNWEAGGDLLKAASQGGFRSEDWKAPVWKSVPRELVVEFLQRYRFHPDHGDLRRDVLLPFINQSDDRLRDWNIAVVESGKGKVSEQALGPLETVQMVNRARLKDTGPTADIKALMSKRDVWIDCEGKPPGGQSWDQLKDLRQRDIGQKPLLLLYPIDRVSPYTGRGDDRVSLGAAVDVLGVGIVFPGSITEGAHFVSVELPTLSPEDLARMEAEEAEDVAMSEAQESALADGAGEQ